MSENKNVVALNADGSLLWAYLAPDRFFGGPALSADGSVLYAADEKRILYAFDAFSGSVLWKVSLFYTGYVETAPAVGPNGEIYVAIKADPGRLVSVDASGALRWVFTGWKGSPFTFGPQVSPNGVVYLASYGKKVYAVNQADGSRAFIFSTPENLLARPAVGSDGTLYIAEEKGNLFVVNPDGSLRFTFRAYYQAFKTTPVLSPGQETVYVAQENRVMYAVDTATGVERWRYNARGYLRASPIVDQEGYVLIGSDAHDLTMLSPVGSVAASFDFPASVNQTPSLGLAGDALVRYGDRDLVFIRKLTAQAKDKPDVQPTSIDRVWELSNPVSIDVGADLLHDQGILGSGVVIAVLDSGVYFDTNVKNTLGTELDQQFLGQVDFVGNGRCSGGGIQRTNYCITDHTNSKDRYGHGSHVAGLIWSRITDFSTGVYMGIAPGADILSVKVLDDKGSGTYSDVIEGIQYVVQNKYLFHIRILNISLSANATTPYFADPFNQAVEKACGCRHRGTGRRRQHRASLRVGDSAGE